MIFTETCLKGAFVIELEQLTDERGFFARSFSQDDFAAYGLNPHVVQCSVSFNAKKGTLRGMHFQTAPHEETKLVRCTMGAIYDVILDLRSTSPTFRRWFSVELSAQNHRMLYIPEGIAHGLQTLEDNTEIFYQISESFHPECAGGARWDDVAFGISWPLPISVMSDKDKMYPAFGSSP